MPCDTYPVIAVIKQSGTWLFLNQRIAQMFEDSKESTYMFAYGEKIAEFKQLNIQLKTLSTKPYANIQFGIGSSVAACQKIKIISCKWIHFGLSSAQKCPIQHLKSIQHDNMISIDIFLLSIPTSTKVISPKKYTETNRQKNGETIKKKTRKVNEIAFTEGILYALPLSTSSYWVKHLWEENFPLPHLSPSFCNMTLDPV